MSTTTPNYNLNKFDGSDDIETFSRLGFNDNADIIDTALKGIQDDIDGLDAADVPYDNTVSGLTANNVQGAIDEITRPVVLTENSDILSSVESGWTIGSSRADIFFGRIVYIKVSGTKSSALPTGAWSTIATLTPALRPTIRKDFAIIDNTGDTIVHGMINTSGELRVWPLTTMREIMFNANYTIDEE